MKFLKIKKLEELKKATGAAVLSQTRDWFIVLIVLFAAILGFLVFDGFVYFRIKVVNSFSIESIAPNAVETFDREALSKIVNDFNVREQNFDSIKNSKIFFADPSISI